ncbi:hypothetical protein [Leptospira borgpetersenii]|nr:hypothetical protein [Leptospira borgpetersenii]
MQGENFEDGLRRMMDRSSFVEFIQIWNSILLKQVGSGKFLGLIARFLNSVEEKK